VLQKQCPSPLQREGEKEEREERMSRRVLGVRPLHSFSHHWKYNTNQWGWGERERKIDRETFMADGAEEVHGEVFLDEAALLHQKRIEGEALLRALLTQSY
jgi:hypothetical protein